MIEQIEKDPKWYEKSILFKLGVIAILILALLIPSAWIQDLIAEREGLQKRTYTEATDSWSAGQLVQGPVLAVPYKKTITVTGPDQKTHTEESTEMLYVLPQDLHIKAAVTTQPYERGVYKTTVYNSKISLNGSFNQPDYKAMDIDPVQVQFDKARLIFGLSDIKGLNNNPTIKIGTNSYMAEPAGDDAKLFENGLQVHFALQQNQSFTFDYQLDLKGSDELKFLHIGRTTDVAVTSNWAHPTFNGSFLPDDKKVTEKGFNAKWHMIYYNRPFPQQWVNDTDMLKNVKKATDATFSIGLQAPIDEYRKIMRTTKYSTLIILLTFVSLFLTELIRKQRIHLFNYTLIGAAMIVYYTLLLSFSEQIGFNWAYLGSSIATIALISWFTSSLLANRNAALMFAGILGMFYGFIFVIIQLEQLSLLVGSVALFAVVAALMYFSRKINWDQH